MRNYILGAVVVALAGCSSMGNYGNYAKATPAVNEALAQSAALKLNNEFPPAATHFALNQTTDDQFGQKFVTELRRYGFAISGKGQEVTAAPGTTQVPLSYIVDTFAPNAYRVTLRAASTTYSRAYTETAPYGAWSKGTK